MNETAKRSSPEDNSTYTDMLEFFKALVDPGRLRIAGLIAAAPLTVAEAAEQSGLGAALTHKHLLRLEAAGLAVAQGSGAEARYALNETRLRSLAASTLDSPRARALAGGRDERGRVLASFFRDGRLTRLPTGVKRLTIVLEEIAKRFADDRVYSEREVNEVLRNLHEDYTTIRRMLVDHVYMNRRDGVYWVAAGRRRPE